jgi:L-alanine-DL-glutamate epimerase-like enolase superfamily enzyme
MNSPVIIKTHAGIIRAPLNQPFRTALGSHTILENVGFVLTLADGTRGCGEAAVASHITGETLRGTLQNLKAIGRRLEGRDARDYLKISGELHERLRNNKSALAAVETAMVDALTRQSKIPLWKFFGKRCRRLKTDITVVLGDLKETETAVKKYHRRGFRAFKVKVGKDFDLDLKRCAAVKRLAPRCAIYLDANQGYSAGQTLRFLKELEKLKVRISLLEQPVPRSDREGLKKVTRSTDIPVCADESVRSLSEARRLIKEKCVDVINVKLMKFGIFESREIACLAKANGIKLMIGGMMETSLAMTAAAHLAAGLSGFDYIDLDTPFFIKRNFDTSTLLSVNHNPFLNAQGVYDLSNVKAGIGIRL